MAKVRVTGLLVSVPSRFYTVCGEKEIDPGLYWLAEERSRGMDVVWFFAADGPVGYKRVISASDLLMAILDGRVKFAHGHFRGETEDME